MYTMKVRHRRSVETRKGKLSVNQVYLEQWCHLHFSVPVLTDKLLHMFLKRCGAGLLSLDLSTAPPYHLTEYSLDLVGQYCCSLRHLNLAHMSVTRVSLKTMAQRLTQLQVCVRMSACVGGCVLA